jgi:hypothetical protein
MTEVCAITKYSCALACVESILKDQGISLTQQQMLDRFAGSFPRWQEHPGILEGKDYDPLFNLAGLPVNICVPAKFADTIDIINDHSFVGAILGTSRLWRDSTKTELIHCFHAFRILAADNSSLTVMDPVLHPGPVCIRKFSWDDVRQFEAQPLAFKRKLTDE